MPDYQLMQRRELVSLALDRGIAVPGGTLLIDLVKQLEAQDNPPEPIFYTAHEVSDALPYTGTYGEDDCMIVFQNRETGEVFGINEVSYESSEIRSTIFLRGEAL